MNVFWCYIRTIYPKGNYSVIPGASVWISRILNMKILITFKCNNLWWHFEGNEHNSIDRAMVRRLSNRHLKHKHPSSKRNEKIISPLPERSPWPNSGGIGLTSYYQSADLNIRWITECDGISVSWDDSHNSNCNNLVGFDFPKLPANRLIPS